MSKQSKIIQDTYILASVQLIKALLSFLRNKVIAIYMGPFGIAAISLYQQIADIYQQLSSLGMDKGIIKEATSGSENQKGQAFSSLIFISTLTLIAVITSALAYRAEIASLFDALYLSSDSVWFTFLSTLILISINVVYVTIMNGFGSVAYIAKSQLYSFLLSSPVSIFYVMFHPEPEMVFCFFLAPFVFFIFNTYYFISERLGLRIDFTFGFNLALIKKIFSSSFSFWLPVISLLIVEIVMRVQIEDKYTTEYLGYYQAAWLIANLCISLLFSSLGISFYPKICQRINDAIFVNESVNRQIVMGAWLALPISCFIIVFPEFVLMVSFSEGFVAASSIITMLCLGAYFRILGFPLGYLLMAKENHKQYLVGQFFFITINYVSFLYVLSLDDFSILGFTYPISYFLYATYLVVICKRYSSFILSRDFYIVFSFSFIAFSFCFLSKLINLNYLLSFSFLCFVGFVSLFYFFSFYRSKDKPVMLD